MYFIFFRKTIKSLLILTTIVGCKVGNILTQNMNSGLINGSNSTEEGGIIVSTEENRVIPFVEENSETNNNILMLPDNSSLMRNCEKKIIDLASFNPFKGKATIVLHEYYMNEAKNFLLNEKPEDLISKEIYLGEYYYPLFSNSEKNGKILTEDIGFNIFPLEFDKSILSENSLNDSKNFASRFWKYVEKIITVNANFDDFCRFNDNEFFFLRDTKIKKDPYRLNEIIGFYLFYIIIEEFKFLSLNQEYKLSSNMNGKIIFGLTCKLNSLLSYLILDYKELFDPKLEKMLSLARDFEKNKFGLKNVDHKKIAEQQLCFNSTYSTFADFETTLTNRDEPAPKVIRAVSFFKTFSQKKRILSIQVDNPVEEFNDDIYQYCPFFLGSKSADIANEICFFWEKFVYETDRAYESIGLLVSGKVDEKSRLIYKLFSNVLSIAYDTKKIHKPKEKVSENTHLRNEIFLEHAAEIVEKLEKLTLFSSKNIPEELKEIQILLDKYFLGIENLDFIDQNMEFLLRLSPLVFFWEKWLNDKENKNLELISHLYFDTLGLYEKDKIFSLILLEMTKNKKEKKKEKTQILSIEDSEKLSEGEIFRIFLDLAPSLYSTYLSQASCYSLLERLIEGESFEAILKSSIFKNKDDFFCVLAHLLLISFINNGIIISSSDCSESKKLFNKLEQLQYTESSCLDLLRKILCTINSDKDKKAFRAQFDKNKSAYPDVISYELYEEEKKPIAKKKKPKLKVVEINKEEIKGLIPNSKKEDIQESKFLTPDKEQEKKDDIEQEIKQEIEEENDREEVAKIENLKTLSLLRNISALDVSFFLEESKHIFDKFVAHNKYASSAKIISMVESKKYPDIKIGIYYSLRSGFFYYESPKNIAKIEIDFKRVYKSIYENSIFNKSILEKKLIEEILKYAKTNDLKIDIYKINDGLNIYILNADKISQYHLVEHMISMQCETNYLSALHNENTNGSVRMSEPLFKRNLFGAGYCSELRSKKEINAQKLENFICSYPENLNNDTEGVRFLKTISPINNIINSEVNDNFFTNWQLMHGLIMMQKLYKLYENEANLYNAFGTYFEYMAFSIRKKLGNKYKF